MKYRKFGSLDWEVSVLGFGVMRLPSMDKDPADLDDAESIKMIRHAIDKGVNYLDLGFPYDKRRYEQRTRIIGRALQDGYRQRVKVTATLPTFSMKTSKDFDRCLYEQLQWLQVDALDFYLLGSLNRGNWPTLEQLGILNAAEKAITNGEVGHLGFSFHDHFQVLRDILNDYDKWSLCQIQYSYMDIDHDPGFSGIKYAADQGLAVVVTEPLRWGRLTKEPPESVAKVWASGSQRRSLTEWGLRWVWNHPEVSVVVSDMSTVEQVTENIAIADVAQPDSLTVRELVLVNRVRDAYQALKVVPCTSCRACMPCPMGTDVPRIFELYNDAVIYDDIETARFIYCAEQHDISRCTECNVCVNACAKRIPILDYLNAARRLFDDTEW